MLTIANLMNWTARGDRGEREVGRQYQQQLLPRLAAPLLAVVGGGQLVQRGGLGGLHGAREGGVAGEGGGAHRAGQTTAVSGNIYTQK